MHFITGGHFNGKSKWVRNSYGLEDQDEFIWVSAYDNEKFEQLYQNKKSFFYILEGVETYIKNLIDKDLENRQIMDQMRNLIAEGLDWEQANEHRNLILIGADISKGVVPIEKKDRLWRDITGWAYQDIVSKSDKADVIWYGISKTLK